MPKPFNECQKKGGKIRTITMPSGKYKYIYILNSKPYRGEIKKKMK